MTALLPDRGEDVVESVPPRGGTRRTLRPGLPRRVGPASRPARVPRAGDDTWAVVSSAATMLALICLWVFSQLLFLSGFSQDRDQELLYREFRTSLAGATASIGPTTQVGDPVALLRMPTIGVSQVVVEGTSSADTEAGPGHLRRTVLPGQVGTSVVMGRSATYGGPFRDLAGLAPGDPLSVVMSQGTVDFSVVAVRRAGDPYSQPPAAGAARLTLVTAEGSGPFAALSPGSVVYVDADAPQGFVPPGGLPTSVPEPEQVLQNDTRAFPLLVLHLALLLAATLGFVAARQRWSAPLVWILATPVVLALAWSTTDVIARLLPNVA